jgi:hypothetical protein
MQKIKRISSNEFEQVLKLDWKPVKLEGDSIPEVFTGMPRATLNSIYASGNYLSNLQYGTSIYPSGILIGGIDVYRNSPEDPVDLNKDWYAVVKLPNDIGYFLVVGPIKDNEHWLNQIPERLQDAEVLGVPPKQS